MKLSSFLSFGMVFLRSFPPGSSAEMRRISSLKTSAYSGCAAKSYKMFVNVMLVVWIAAKLPARMVSATVSAVGFSFFP
jgi:hypothetical protein